jgi:hypothetical protein
MGEAKEAGMTTIVHDGIRWKDTGDGIWSGFVTVLGGRMMAHGIEVEGDDQHAATTSGAYFLDVLSPILARPYATIKLAEDVEVVLVIV